MKHNYPFPQKKFLAVNEKRLIWFQADLDSALDFLDPIDSDIPYGGKLILN